MNIKFSRILNETVELNVAIAGNGPTILLIHGFPGLWYSWRHAMSHFASIGYQVIAQDVRGYGGSSKPIRIDAYKLRDLVSDAVAIIDALGNSPVYVVGDDWGAIIAWHLALLSPKRVRAVAGLSVPYQPPGPTSFIDLARQTYREKFFYQIFFQEVGRPEERLEFSVEETMRYFLFSKNRISAFNRWLTSEPSDKNQVSNPLPCPDWMSENELEVFVEAFSKGGFTGPLNRYRAQQLDVNDLISWTGATIQQPSFFIGGEADPFRHSLPGIDLFQQPGKFCSDFRGSVLIPKIGHWVQQEAPEIVNRLLADFFLNAI
jgi:pimeloyl-ACP methyl ester carboxylesterase